MTAYAELEAKVGVLRQPQSYPEETRSVTALETHFAWVFLTDTHAYKLKKPIRVPGFDLTQVTSREHACREELRLNRRLAPDVYLGVVQLACDDNGRLRISGEGTVLDWLVRMRRLPQHLMLDRVMAERQVSAPALDAIATCLTRFYQGQPAVPFTPDAYVARIRGQVEANQAALLDPALGLPAGTVRRLAGLQRSCLAKLGSGIGQRAAEGRIIEAHGDLRPEHICLADPPYIIDCLEFSHDLRLLDRCEELAYLGIECRRAGADPVGQQLLGRYQALSGDVIPEALQRFYRSHRATTRAKVVAWHRLDPAYRDRADWPANALAYLEIAGDEAGAALAP